MPGTSLAENEKTLPRCSSSPGQTRSMALACPRHALPSTLISILPGKLDGEIRFSAQKSASERLCQSGHTSKPKWTNDTDESILAGLQGQARPPGEKAERQLLDPATRGLPFEAIVRRSPAKQAPPTQPEKMPRPFRHYVEKEKLRGLQKNNDGKGQEDRPGGA